MPDRMKNNGESWEKALSFKRMFCFENYVVQIGYGNIKEKESIAINVMNPLLQLMI